MIDLTSGSASARELADGDTLLTIPRGEFDGARASLAIAAQNLPQIVDNVQDVKTAVFSQSGTIGAMGHGDAITRPLVSIGDNLDKLSGRLDHRRAAMHGAGPATCRPAHTACSPPPTPYAGPPPRKPPARAARTTTPPWSARFRTHVPRSTRCSASSRRPPRTRPARPLPSRASSNRCRISTRSSPAS